MIDRMNSQHAQPDDLLDQIREDERIDILQSFFAKGAPAYRPGSPSARRSAAQRTRGIG